jgi:hypothetical protein
VGLLAHLRLAELADRKQTSPQLDLAELTQKVGLVLDGIGGAQQMNRAAAVLDPRVVAGGDEIEAAVGAVDERSELDRAVADDVRARRSARLELRDRVADNILEVLALE